MRGISTQFYMQNITPSNVIIKIDFVVRSYKDERQDIEKLIHSNLTNKIIDESLDCWSFVGENLARMEIVGFNPFHKKVLAEKIFAVVNEYDIYDKLYAVSYGEDKAYLLRRNKSATHYAQLLDSLFSDNLACHDILVQDAIDDMLK